MVEKIKASDFYRSDGSYMLGNKMNEIITVLNRLEEVSASPADRDQTTLAAKLKNIKLMLLTKIETALAEDKITVADYLCSILIRMDKVV